MYRVPIDPDHLSVEEPSNVLVGAVVLMAIIMAIMFVYVVKSSGRIRSIDKQVNQVEGEHPTLQTQMGDQTQLIRELLTKLAVLSSVVTRVEGKQDQFESRWGAGGGGMDGELFEDAAGMQEFLHTLREKQDLLEEALKELQEFIRKHDEWERSVKYEGKT